MMVTKIAPVFFMGILSVIVYTGCKSNSDTPPVPANTDGQYLNLNKGSTWEYITDSATETSVVTVIDSVKNMFSKSFKVFHTTVAGVTSSTYYTWKSGNYYLLTPGVSGLVEVVYLKDSSSVGKKWTQMVNTTGTDVAYNYEVKENKISKTIQGKTYNNLVHIQLNIPVSGYVADAYYAPAIGLVKHDINSGGTTSVTELKTYTLR